MDSTHEGTRAPPIPQSSAQDSSFLAPQEESILDLPAPSTLPASPPHLPPYYPYDFSQSILQPVASAGTMGPPIDSLGAPWSTFSSFHFTDPLTEPQWGSSLSPLLPPPAQRAGLAGPWISRFAASGSSTAGLNDTQRRMAPAGAIFTTSSQRPLDPQYLAQGRPPADANHLAQSQVPLFPAYQVQESPTNITQRQIHFLQPETTATPPHPSSFGSRSGSPDIYPQPGPARVLREEEFSSVSEQIASISQTERYLRAELRAKGVDIPEHVPLNLDALDDTEDGSKPPYDLGILLRLAIWGSERRMMLLSEMKSAIEKRFTWYKGQNDRWKQSIRHKLSLKAIFVQRKRSEDSPGRGAYWTIDIRGGNCESRKRKKRKRQPTSGSSRKSAPGGSRAGSARSAAVAATRVRSPSTTSQRQDSGSQHAQSSDEDDEAEE